MQPGMTPTLCAEMPTNLVAVPSSAAAFEESTSEESISLGTLTCEGSLVEAAFAELRLLLGAKRYSLWFEGKIGLNVRDDLLTVAVGSPFLLNWMQKQFKEITTQAARAVLGPSARVAFAVDATLSVGRSASVAASAVGSSLGEQSLIVDAIPRETNTYLRESPSRSHDAAANDTALAKVLASTDAIVPRRGTSATAGSQPIHIPTATPSSSRGRRFAELHDFIPGPNTELALTAARQVATGQPRQFYQLYIHGPVGSGKTHLLEGICRQLKRTQPTANVMLLTSEAFANYFTQALRDKTLPSFRQRFRTVDTLLVDDIEFFESKRVFQEEFLHTFAELVDHGRQVVLSGSRHPRLLTKLGDELGTRFLSGLVCRLDVPDPATRQKIVETKAARLSGEFAPEALQYVAQRFQNSVRELEGALNCLQTYHAMTRKRVTLSAARHVLADLERDCLRIVRLADVVRVVCGLFGVKSKDLESESRVRTISQPRMLAMFLARKHTQSAYNEIGQHFGGRNHSTVMSAERKVQQWLDENSTIQVASQSWTIGEILSTLEQQLLAG